MTPLHSALHSAVYTLGRSWRISGSVEESYEGRKRLGITRQMLAHVTRTGRTSIAGAADWRQGRSERCTPRDHVVTIGLRNTLYGELAARDSPLYALTHPRTPSATG